MRWKAGAGSTQAIPGQGDEGERAAAEARGACPRPTDPTHVAGNSAQGMDGDEPCTIRACLCASGTCVLRGERDVKSLQAWRGGAFGELLIVDAETGQRCERKQGSTVLLLRLRAVEAYYLAFGSDPPRLHVVEPPEAPEDEDPPTLGSAACSSSVGPSSAEGKASPSGVGAAMPQPTADGGSFNILKLLDSAADAPPLGSAECWALLMEAEPRLPYLYAAYVALRRAGWFIRDGIKFGFDFALYNAAASAAKHAPLGALVLTPHDHDIERSWLWVQRHSRVCHSVGKGLLLCSVEHPQPLGDGGGDGGAGAVVVGAGPNLSAPEAASLVVSTMRIDGWDPDRAHAKLSDPNMKKGASAR